jgi:hypothetical protein
MAIRIVLIVVVFGPAAVADAALVYEDFSVDPHWSVVGSGANGNSFGYQTSAHAGGASGEAGGRFTRSHFQRYLADAFVDETLGLNDAFFASGKLDVTLQNSADFGPGLVIGYFDTSDAFGGASVGLYFNHDDMADRFYCDLFLRFTDGSISRQRLMNSVDTNQDRTWRFEWDPSGGSFGGARLTGSLSGPGEGTASIDIPLAELATKIATFDAFGLSSGSTSPLSGNPNRSDWYADVFLDNVTYMDAPIPEPGAFVLAAGLFGTVLLKRFRKCRVPWGKRARPRFSQASPVPLYESSEACRV